MSTKSSHKRRSQQAKQANRPTLQHVTVTTGHNRCDSPLSEVDSDCMEFFQEWLMEGEIVMSAYGDKFLGQTLPDDHHAQVTLRGNTLACTVFDPFGQEVVTFLINEGDAESQLAWNHLLDLQTLQMFTEYPEKAPEGRWCGVVLHQMKPLFDSFGWLADFERTLAWAWFTWNEDNKEAFREYLDYPPSFSELEEFECIGCPVCGGNM